MSIAYNWFEVPNPFTRKNVFKRSFRQSVALFVFVFKIIVCKDDDFSVLRATKIITENFAKMYHNVHKVNTKWN